MLKIENINCDCNITRPFQQIRMYIHLGIFLREKQHLFHGHHCHLQTSYSFLKLLLSQFMSHRRKIKKKIYSHISCTADGKFLTSVQLVLVVIKATDMGTDSMKIIKVHN